MTAENRVRWHQRFKTMPAPAGLHVWVVWGKGDGIAPVQAEGPYQVIALGFVEAAFEVSRVESKAEYVTDAGKKYQKATLDSLPAENVADDHLRDWPEYESAWYYALGRFEQGGGTWLKEGEAAFTNEDLAREAAESRNRAMREEPS